MRCCCNRQSAINPLLAWQVSGFVDPTGAGWGKTSFIPALFCLFVCLFIICLFVCLFICTPLTADGPRRARLPIPPTATLASCMSLLIKIFPSYPSSRLRIYIAMQVHPEPIMVELYLLTFSRFPLRRRQNKNPEYVKNRTHDLRTSDLRGSTRATSMVG